MAVRAGRVSVTGHAVHIQLAWCCGRVEVILGDSLQMASHRTVLYGKVPAVPAMQDCTLCIQSVCTRHLH